MVMDVEFQSQPFLAIYYTNGEILEGSSQYVNRGISPLVQPLDESLWRPFLTMNSNLNLVSSIITLMSIYWHWNFKLQ